MEGVQCRPRGDPAADNRPPHAVDQVAVRLALVHPVQRRGEGCNGDTFKLAMHRKNATDREGMDLTAVQRPELRVDRVLPRRDDHHRLLRDQLDRGIARPVRDQRRAWRAGQRSLPTQPTLLRISENILSRQDRTAYPEPLDLLRCQFLRAIAPKPVHCRHRYANIVRLERRRVLWELHILWPQQALGF